MVTTAATTLQWFTAKPQQVALWQRWNATLHHNTTISSIQVTADSTSALTTTLLGSTVVVDGIYSNASFTGSPTLHVNGIDHLLEPFSYTVQLIGANGTEFGTFVNTTCQT